MSIPGSMTDYKVPMKTWKPYQRMTLNGEEYTYSLYFEGPGKCRMLIQHPIKNDITIPPRIDRILGYGIQAVIKKHRGHFDELIYDFPEPTGKYELVFRHLLTDDRKRPEAWFVVRHVANWTKIQICTLDKNRERVGKVLIEWTFSGKELIFLAAAQRFDLWDYADMTRQEVYDFLCQHGTHICYYCGAEHPPYDSCGECMPYKMFQYTKQAANMERLHRVYTKKKETL